MSITKPQLIRPLLTSEKVNNQSIQNYLVSQKASKTPPSFHENPGRAQRVKFQAGEGKKNENFIPPPFWAAPFGAPLLLDPHLFWVWPLRLRVSLLLLLLLFAVFHVVAASVSLLLLLLISLRVCCSFLVLFCLLLSLLPCCFAAALLCEPQRATRCIVEGHTPLPDGTTRPMLHLRHFCAHAARSAVCVMSHKLPKKTSQKKNQQKKHLTSPPKNKKNKEKHLNKKTLHLPNPLPKKTLSPPLLPKKTPPLSKKKSFDQLWIFS